VRVTCFCGTEYEFDGHIGPCPECEAIATDGTLTEEEAWAMISDEVEDFLDTIEYENG
jgi:hypothetical protein